MRSKYTQTHHCTLLNIEQSGYSEEMHNSVQLEEASEISSNENIPRRRVRTNPNTEAEENVTDNFHDEDEVSQSTSQNNRRRRAFNICKHIISIVFICLDVTFDWISFAEMSIGNFTISVEKQVGNVEFTYECEGTGNTVKLIYIVISTLGTILSLIQGAIIVYQIYGEVNTVRIRDHLIHEYLEAFMILLFVKIGQVLLLMVFIKVCSFECTVDWFDIVLSTNSGLSLFRIMWRVVTSFRWCSIRESEEQHSEEDCCCCSNENCIYIIVIFAAFLFSPIWIPMFVPCFIISQTCNDGSYCRRNCCR